MGHLLREEVRALAARPLPEALRAQLLQYAANMRPLAPADFLEEQEAMAKEAGVLAFDLFVREAARDGLRWHDAAGAPRAASFASVPGAAPDVVVAFEEAGLDPNGLIVIERHPTGGRASLCLARSGETGVIGGVGDGGLIVVGAEVAVDAEQRSLKAAPFSWSLRASIERTSTAMLGFASIANLCGHRVLAADSTNARALGVVSLGSSPPTVSDAQAWVLSSSATDDRAPLTRAVEGRLASYASRPGAAEAVDLALAGRARDVVGPVARWSPDGLVWLLSVGTDGIVGPDAAFTYRWSGNGKLVRR